MQRDDLIRILCGAPPIIGVLCVAMILYIAFMAVRLPRPAEVPATGPVEAATWPEVRLPDPDAWRVFVGEGAGAPAGTPAQAYRLAGTFFMMPTSDGADPVRKAVLDDLKQGAQFLVEEGEGIGDAVVSQILRDRVTLRFGAQEETLWLRFTDSTPAPAADSATVQSQRWDEVTLETSHFGRKIATNRWILSRNVLLAYRNELLDDPERLANLFISMTAEREDGQIEGYRLKRQGEEEFYAAIGFEEGDVVRRVNSMKMTRQDRAEYFIREFVDDRLNAVVIDVERDGNPLKLIYYLRE